MSTEKKTEGTENSILSAYRDRFSKKLVQLRKAKGAMQHEVAKAVNYSYQAISFYEGGQSAPTIDRAALLADYFEVSLDSMLGRDDFCTSEIKCPEDVAKILILLRTLGIAELDDSNGSIALNISGEEYCKAFNELSAYIALRAQNKNVKDFRFDKWYDAIYERIPERKNVVIPEKPRYAYQYRGFPQNIISAAFAEKYDTLPGVKNISAERFERVLNEIDLTERERDILQKRYQGQKILEEVGKELGVTRERIRQIESRGLKKIRESSRVIELIENCQD